MTPPTNIFKYWIPLNATSNQVGSYLCHNFKECEQYLALITFYKVVYLALTYFIILKTLNFAQKPNQMEEAYKLNMANYKLIKMQKKI